MDEGRNVREMEKGCLGDVFDVLLEGESLAKDDTKATDVEKSEQSKGADREVEVMSGFD